jgi:hypothetical protein
MKRLDKQRAVVIIMPALSACLFVGCAVLKHCGFFDAREVFDSPLSVFVTTKPLFFWILAACMGVCAIISLNADLTLAACMGAGFHGLWAAWCTRLALIGWFSTGTALCILLYWSLTLGLAVVALASWRKRKTEQSSPPVSSDTPPNGDS